MSNEGYDSDKNKAAGDFEKPKDGIYSFFSHIALFRICILRTRLQAGREKASRPHPLRAACCIVLVTVEEHA